MFKPKQEFQYFDFSTFLIFVLLKLRQKQSNLMFTLQQHKVWLWKGEEEGKLMDSIQKLLNYHGYSTDRTRPNRKRTQG